jgi:hypothetical protein
MTHDGPKRTLRIRRRYAYIVPVSDQRTDDKRMRTAVRRANWESIRGDLYRIRVPAAVIALLVIAVVAFGRGPRRDVGSVEGRIIAFNQTDSKRGNPPRLITVRLDDGRTVTAWTGGGLLPQLNTRVRLRETQHLGWWRRSTFRLDEMYAPEEQ